MRKYPTRLKRNPEKEERKTAEYSMKNPRHTRSLRASKYIKGTANTSSPFFLFLNNQSTPFTLEQEEERVRAPKVEPV